MILIIIGVVKSYLFFRIASYKLNQYVSFA